MGTLTSGETTVQGNASDIWGAESGASDPNLTERNQVVNAAGGALPAGGDVVTNVATSLPTGTPGVAFDQFLLADADINVLALTRRLTARMYRARSPSTPAINCRTGWSSSTR
jgi:hypothetical protein